MPNQSATAETFAVIGWIKTADAHTCVRINALWC